MGFWLPHACMYTPRERMEDRAYVVDPRKNDYWPIPTNVNRDLPSFATPTFLRPTLCLISRMEVGLSVQGS